MQGGEDNLDVARLQLPDRPPPAAQPQPPAQLPSPPSSAPATPFSSAGAPSPVFPTPSPGTPGEGRGEGLRGSSTGTPSAITRGTGGPPVGGAAAKPTVSQIALPFPNPQPIPDTTGETPVLRAPTGEPPVPRSAQPPLSVTTSVQEIRRSAAGGWTFPFLCAGIALVACCILLPQFEENRKLMYECAKLKLDLNQIKDQVAANDEFVRRVSEDRTLAERLAQRQLRLVREDAAILELKGGSSRDEMCPLTLMAVPPPAQLPDYQPMTGRLAALCRNKHTQTYVMGTGLMLIAFGLVLGYHPQRRRGGPSL